MKRRPLAIRPKGWRPPRVCNQCSHELTYREASKHRFPVELRNDVTLAVRLFADDTNPERVGPVLVEMSSVGVNLGYMQPGYPAYRFDSWADLFDALDAGLRCGVELIERAKAPEHGKGGG